MSPVKSACGENSPVIVFQMGKVGSTTVFRSLKSFCAGIEVYHCHRLSLFRKHLRHHGDTAGPIAGRARKVAAEKDRNERVAQGIELVERISRGDRFDVITLVRDPVARNVSAFFEKGEKHLSQILDRYAASGIGAAELTGVFLDDWDGHHLPLHWFDREVKKVFDIDVYAEPFPHDAGHRTYSTTGSRLLVLRLEDLDRCGPRAIGDFLGIHGFRLRTANAGLRKPYRRAYEDFLRSVELPAEYLDRTYQSKFARHFYSDAQRQAFRDYWEKGDRRERPPDGTSRLRVDLRHALGTLWRKIRSPAG